MNCQSKGRLTCGLCCTSSVHVIPHCLQGPWFWAAKTEGRIKVSDWTKASATAVFGEGRNPGAAGQMMGRKNRGNQLKAGLKTRFGDLKEKEVGAGCTRVASLDKVTDTLRPLESFW